MSKLGVFRGTFDPIHDGHVAFALETIKSLGLDKIVFLVEREPYHKTDVSDYTHRLAMVELATGPHPELAILKTDLPTFSIEKTLSVLKSSYPKAQLWFLVGSDLASHFHTWPGAKELLARMELVVGAREGAGTDHKNMVKTTRAELASSKLRRCLACGQLPIGLNYAVSQYALKHRLYSKNISAS